MAVLNALGDSGDCSLKKRQIVPRQWPCGIRANRLCVAGDDADPGVAGAIAERGQRLKLLLESREIGEGNERHASLYRKGRAIRDQRRNLLIRSRFCFARGSSGVYGSRSLVQIPDASTHCVAKPKSGKP